MSKPHVEYFRSNIHKLLNSYTCQMKHEGKERCKNEIKYQYILIKKSNRNLSIYYICKECRGDFVDTIEQGEKMVYIGSFD